jgi:hypothetical protein
MKLRTIVILIVASLGLRPAGAQTAADKAANPGWKKLEFLLGRWTGTAGEKDTPLGAGQGGFSFELELNGKIIVRRNQAAYDSGDRHEDLMVIYLDAPGDAPRAIYFDTEGHVIRYSLAFPAPNSVTFLSDEHQPGPRYRLSYRLNGGTLDGKFEVAQPGAEFKTYLSWTSKKQ